MQGNYLYLQVRDVVLSGGNEYYPLYDKYNGRREGKKTGIKYAKESL